MAENIEYVKLSGRMKSVAKDKVLAETSSIFDEESGKFQNEINIRNEAVMLSDILAVPQISIGLTDEDGSVVYDTKSKKLLWKVNTDGAEQYYAEATKCKYQLGEPPTKGTRYICGSETYVGVRDGLSQLFHTTEDENDKSIVNFTNGGKAIKFIRTASKAVVLKNGTILQDTIDEEINYTISFNKSIPNFNTKSGQLEIPTGGRIQINGTYIKINACQIPLRDGVDPSSEWILVYDKTNGLHFIPMVSRKGKNYLIIGSLVQTYHKDAKYYPGDDCYPYMPFDFTIDGKFVWTDKLSELENVKSNPITIIGKPIIDVEKGTIDLRNIIIVAKNKPYEIGANDGYKAILIKNGKSSKQILLFDTVDKIFFTIEFVNISKYSLDRYITICSFLVDFDKDGSGYKPFELHSVSSTFEYTITPTTDDIVSFMGHPKLDSVHGKLDLRGCVVFINGRKFELSDDNIDIHPGKSSEHIIAVSKKDGSILVQEKSKILPYDYAFLGSFLMNYSDSNTFKVLKEYNFPVDFTISYGIDKYYRYNDVVVLLRQMNTGKSIGKTDHGDKRNPCLNFIHFSDIHGDEDNLKRVCQFYNRFSDENTGKHIADIICSGDMVSNKVTPTSMDFWKSFSDNKNKPSCMLAIGNHDAYKDEGLPWLTGKECYDLYMSPYRQFWGNVNFPTDAETEGKCYYYKDYVSEKVRLIVLDCMHYDDAQNSWFAGELEDARTKGYHVIACSHYYADNPVAIENCTFNNTDGKLNIPQSKIDSKAISAVDSFKTNGGHFICWICGHTHFDVVAHLATYPNQMEISIDQARHTYNTNDCLRTGKSQDCFNIISIDTAANIIKVLRIGEDTNRLMQSKQILIYNYANNEMIYNR